MQSIIGKRNTMKATIITIGDEILIGQITDTNSTFISQRLNEVGITVVERVSIGDVASEITATLDRALSRSEIVITTGGLGPTKDDITKTTLAAYFGVSLVRNEESYRLTEQMMASRGIEFNALNRDQSLVPEGAIVFQNHNGTAPGMMLERDGRIVVSLPGVPFEMKALMEESVIPLFISRFNLRPNIHRTMITYGLPESVLAETIAEWEDALPPYMHLAYLPSPSAMRLRLSAYDARGEQVEQQIMSRFAQLEKIIAPYIIGYGEVTVQAVVADLLRERGATLAVAESCTGGRIASMFTAMAGASDYFECGVVTYSNASKIKILSVDTTTLARYGAVSQQIAEQMAQGALAVSDADYAIATTGIAGPTGGTPTKPVGTVWIAVASREGGITRKMEFGNLREQNIERASTSAINLLRLLLLNQTETKTTESIL
jgi:nicotinamide-nucleotide amidase